MDGTKAHSLLDGTKAHSLFAHVFVLDLRLNRGEHVLFYRWRTMKQTE